MTPVWANRASTAASGLARAAVWEEAARWPEAVRPALTATIGFWSDACRATWANRRGSPKDSRYRRMTSVSGSCCPVLEEIVAADVGLVSHGNEAGQSDAAAGDFLEDGDPEPAGLRREGDSTWAGGDGGEGGVHLHVDGGVDDAHAVRPDHSHAAAVGLADQLALFERLRRCRLRRNRLR